MDPKISIVTPSYNCGKYIEETILSVINQDYDNLEYFVIDGESTDNTVKILKQLSKKYPGKFKWISEPDKGQTNAVNKGLKMCSGDWFAFQNADDYYEPNIFSKIAQTIKSNPNSGVIYGNCFTLFENNTKKLSIPPKEINYKSLKNGNLIYGPASFYNIQAIKKVGGYDETLNHWLDYEMYIRISKIMPVRYIDLNIANFRRRHEQKSKAKNLQQEFYTEASRVIKKYYPKYFIYYSIRKSIRNFYKKLSS